MSRTSALASAHACGAVVVQNGACHRFSLQFRHSGSIPPISTDSHQSLQLQRYVPRMGTRWVQQNGAGHWKVLLPMVGACLLVTQMSDVISLGGSGTNRSVVPFGSVKRRSSMMRWSLWPQPSAAR